MELNMKINATVTFDQEQLKELIKQAVENKTGKKVKSIRFDIDTGGRGGFGDYESPKIRSVSVEVDW